MKTFKKFLIALIGAAVLVYTPGCFIDIDDDDNPFGCIDANGSIVSEELNLGSFHSVELRVAGKVYIRQGTQQEVIVEAPRDLIRELELDVRNGLWEIETDRCVRYNNSDFTVYITIPDIRSLRVSGSGDIISENTLRTGDLDLSVSGSGRIDAAVEADDIDANISGSGSILLEGTADFLDFLISGSGDFKCFDLLATSAFILISGSGDAEVNLSDSLDVKISGSGDVFYKGNPSVNTQISGSGRVINAN